VFGWTAVLPKSGAAYLGPQVPFYFLTAIAAANTIRSLIHLSPDGGASTIAGIPLDGGTKIDRGLRPVGREPVLLALLYWAVILRYRFLMLFTVFAEQALRSLAGSLKPIEAAHTPPGAIGGYLLLPAPLIMFLWGLRTAGDRSSQ
jgi:hypothetical protein